MGEFLFERLSDPEYYEENRVAAHSDHVAYRNWDEADVWLDPWYGSEPCTGCLEVFF